jgi:hypothetical protein
VDVPRSRTALFFVLAGTLSAAAPARADDDILCLKDGRIFCGPKMARVAGGVEVLYKAGKVFVSQDLIQDAVLAEDLKISPLTDEEKEKTSQGFVRFENKWVTPKQREETLQKRILEHKKVLEEMRNHGEWRNRYVEDGKYFHFEYTVPQRIFEPYRDEMEAYFAEFAKTWKIQPPKNNFRLPVCFYSDEQSFLQIGGVPKGVLGYFDPSRKDLNIFYERLDPVLSEDVMFHEANHYLQSLVEPHFWIPHFPGESLAEYYGASQWDPVKKKLTVGLMQEGRLCQIQSDIAAGNLMDLAKLVSTHDLFEHYSWGWSLVHFLMNDSRYASKFMKFFLALPEAKGVQREEAAFGMYTIKQEDVLTIFMREFGLKDANALRKMDAEWHNYIESKLQLVSYRGYERAGLEAKREKRNIRATRLLKTAIEKGSKNPLVFLALGAIYGDDKKDREALDAWKKALEIDPFAEKVYAKMAVQLKGSDKKESNRLRALAVELGADDPWAEPATDEEGDEGSPEPGKKKKPGEQPGEPPR